MVEIKYYLVDLFTSLKHEGDQLAVLIDYEDIVSEKKMYEIAQNFNFSEITFVRKKFENEKFEVRIFRSGYEVFFAGPPCLATAFIISKFLLSKPTERVTLSLKNCEIIVDLSSVSCINKRDFVIEQWWSKFIRSTSLEIANRLGVQLQSDGNMLKLMEQISTSEPYIISYLSLTWGVEKKLKSFV